LLEVFPETARIPSGGIKGLCTELQGWKNKNWSLEIHVTTDMIVEVTEIPRTGEQWFKAKKIEKEDWCQDMLRPEHRGVDLVKGVPRKWLIEDYDKMLFIIQRFFTCEGRYNWVLQYHFKLLLHFTGKKEIDLSFFLFKSLQRMISFAQRKPDKLQKSIFHHALIKLIVLEQLKKEGKDWPTFLFVSNYHIDFPPSPPKHKASKKKIATPPIDSSVPSSEIPPPIDPPAPSFEVALDSSPSSLTPEIAQPSGSTVPHASEKHQPSQILFLQNPHLPKSIEEIREKKRPKKLLLKNKQNLL
jgi:hypothetical protein